MQYLSPSCQQVVSNNLDIPDAKPGELIVRSCLSDPDLKLVVMDHRCNGCILTPSGLYSDMAVTIATYIFSVCNQDCPDPSGINISDLQVHKPLIVKEPRDIDKLWIEVVASYEKTDVQLATVKEGTGIAFTFYSITPDGIRLQQQGHCTASFEDSSKWLDDWTHLAPTLLDRISSLRTRAIKENNADVRLIQRDQAYKLFETFVQYGARYQNMSEVIYDTTTLEATSTIDFPRLDPNGKLNGPYYMDGSCHLAGFVCNAVDESIDKFAYINAGVGSMKLSPKFRPERIAGSSVVDTDGKCAVMQNYVHMRASLSDKTVLQGVVFILQDDEIVGVWEAVKFKRIPRKVLDVFLPPPKK